MELVERDRFFHRLEDRPCDDCGTVRKVSIYSPTKWCRSCAGKRVGARKKLSACKICGADEIKKFNRCSACFSVYNKERNLFRYGLTKDEYDFMMAQQDGHCAICKQEMGRPNVDHDHVTGKVRGLLCTSCNCGIGYLDDNPHILRSAALYLEEE